MSDHHAASAAHRDELRARLRRLRNDLSLDEQRVAARRAADRLEEWAAWRGATRIGLYRAVGGELDPQPAADDARGRGATTFVPILDGEVLRFAAYDETSSWRPNRYGIDEPTGAETVDVATLDILLVPAVAVDRRGNRVGMGAGWYDRTLATVPRVGDGGPMLVAFVHAMQVVVQIPPHEWDIPVDLLVTPDGVTATR